MELMFNQLSVVGADSNLLKIKRQMESLLVDLREAHLEAKRYLLDWYGI